MQHESQDARKQIDDLLNLPNQSWLLGAGISFDAHIPLMIPLTARVAKILSEHGEPYFSIFNELQESLSKDAHIEHILSHIGDLIAIAQRSRNKTAKIHETDHEQDSLETLHRLIQQAISDTVRWGYRSESDGQSELVGTRENPVVKVDKHREFVRALFTDRRAGHEQRPAVNFFTINYDTLLEDALALERVRSHDGFIGGAMAFWEPSNGFAPVATSYKMDAFQAKLFKLHGSIDWFAHEEDVVVRRREGAPYPPSDPARLLIYPQATKYQLTQRAPFANVFSEFRSALNHKEQSLLAICGYSFGDDHINEEIERALKQRGNGLTVLVFSYQDDGDLQDDQLLPKCIYDWLGDNPNNTDDWRKRIVVAGRRGVYNGSLQNNCPTEVGKEHTWWSFSGVTHTLSKGTNHSS